MKLSKSNKTDKKIIVFVIAVLLLIISIVYRVLNPFEQQRTDKLTYTGKKPTKTKIETKNILISEKQSVSGDIVSKFLNRPKISAKVYNDLFLKHLPPRQPGESVQINLLSNHDISDMQKESDAFGTNTVQQIKEYISSYRLYGTYKSGNTKAVFLSKDKLVLVAKIGDRLDGKYLIDDIQDNYIKIRALDLNETIHLDMKEFNNE